MDQGLHARGGVYTYGGDSHLYDSLNIGHREVLRLWVSFKGESAHSGSLAWKQGMQGYNAITPMTEFINQVEKLDFSVTNPFFPEYRFTPTHMLLQTGVRESIVPSEAKVAYDICPLPEHSAENILAEIHKTAQGITSRRGYIIDIKTSVPAALSNPEDPFIKKAHHLHKEIFYVDAPLKGSGPANESHMLIKQGIPAIAGYGPIGGGFHAMSLSLLNLLKVH